MTSSMLRLLPAIAILLTAPCAAAQSTEGAQQSLDQFPSFIELTTSMKDGTQVVLRCGYVASGSTIAIDPAFAEISSINPSRGTYARLQHIDTSVVATAPAPTGTLGLHLQLVKGNNPVFAKICQTNTANDTISNCQPAEVNEPAIQMLGDDRKLGSQCVDLIEQAKPQSNPANASPEKTQQFMATMREKVATLEGK